MQDLPQPLLPPDVIDHIISPDPTAGRAAARTARPWEQDFPFTIQEVVTAATRTASTDMPIASAAPARHQQQARHGPQL